MSPRKILTYFDFCCPFCYNAHLFMEKIRPLIELEEDFYTWEIHPEVPLSGKIAQWLGRDEMVAKVNALGEAVGVHPGDYNKLYNTRKALQIFELAREQNLALPYIRAVFHAYWEEKLNIAEDSIILALASKVGVTGAAEVLATGKYLDLLAQHDKHCLDINLEFVPTFMEEGKIILSGVLSLDDIKNTFLK